MKSKRSIFSPVSEDLALDYEPQAELFPQSPSVSKTPSAKPSCESTGLTHQSTTMSDNLKETRNPPLQMELTSSAAGSRNCASLGVSPGSSEAQKMTVISGRKCCELLKLYKVDGSLGKMSEALLMSRWASSAAFLTWKASDIKSSPFFYLHVQRARGTEEIASGSSDTKMWPTPNASDSKQANMKDDHDLKKGYLRGVVKMWATPNTMDFLPARDAADCSTNQKNREGRKRSGNLREQVVHPEMWPTPNASDYKGARSPEAIKNSGRNPLTNSLKDHVGATNPAEKGKLAGSLNPTWVEWLMGFPTGWTDLKPSEMPLSRKSSNKSAKQSLRQSDE